MIWDESNFFRRYGLLLVLTAFCGGLFGAIHARLLPRLYQASATLQLPPGRKGRRVASPSNASAPRPQFVSELTVLKSDRLARRVLVQLGLTRRADFLGFTPPERPAPEEQEELTQQALAILHDGFSVSLVTGTNLARLRFTSRSPQLSAAIANVFLDDFLIDRSERSYDDAQRGEELTAPRLDELRAEFTAAQRRLLELQQQLQAPGFSPRTNQIAAGLAQLSAAERAATLARIEDQDRAALMRSSLAAAPDRPALEVAAASPPGILGASTPDEGVAGPRDQFGSPPVAPAAGSQDGVAARLQKELDSARPDLARLSAQLGPQHPERRAAAARVASLEQSLKAEQRRAVLAAGQRVQLDARQAAGLHADYTERLEDARQVEPQLREYALLERQYVFARTLYYRFVTRLRSRSLDAGLSQAGASVVDRAHVPVEPLPREDWMYVLACAALSLLLVCPVALVLRLRDDLLLRVDLLERLTGLPTLAVLPQVDRLSVNGYARMLAKRTHGQQDEKSLIQWAHGLFDLRAAVTVLAEDPRPSRILVTSSRPGEGKSSVSCSLAMTLAHGGRRILLIDADLHRPTLHRQFHLVSAPGLSNVLSLGMPLAEAVQPAPQTPGLDILTSGPHPPEPDRLLASAAMRALLAEAAKTYAIVLLDAPPVLAVQDALVLTQLADCVLWVTRDLSPRLWLALRTRKLLEAAGAPVAGLVVNGIRTGQD